MNRYFHILNGDALLYRFPKTILGERIIFRECLVDGPVHGSTLEVFYKTRAEFISNNYPNTSTEDYYNKSVREIDKINSIPSNSIVLLWFEDDLFCQVNLWFTIHLLKNRNCKLFLVRPKIHTQYGFGGINSEELESILHNKIVIPEDNELKYLWNTYQQNDLSLLLNYANKLNQEYPYILDAVQAHIQRQPTNNYKGRPTASILKIMEDLNTSDFSTIFKEFCKRESIYGFGDLQVKRIYDSILNT